MKMASYPPAPWTLQGFAVATLHLLDIDRVRSLIPPMLDLVSVFPGKTLGGVYLSNYSTSSVLEYNELIVAVAVSHAGQIGSWITHIYVDHPDSVAGGREIWGLPKELAAFTWGKNSVNVRQDQRTLCNLNYNALFSIGWKPRLGASSFSTIDSELMSFPAEVEASFGLVNAQIEIPATSPFAPLALNQPWLSVQAQQMRLQVGAPKVVR